MKATRPVQNPHHSVKVSGVRIRATTDHLDVVYSDQKVVRIWYEDTKEAIDLVEQILESISLAKLAKEMPNKPRLGRVFRMMSRLASESDE